MSYFVYDPTQRTASIFEKKHEALQVANKILNKITSVASQEDIENECDFLTLEETEEVLVGYLEMRAMEATVRDNDGNRILVMVQE